MLERRRAIPLRLHFVHFHTGPKITARTLSFFYGKLVATATTKHTRFRTLSVSRIVYNKILVWKVQERVKVKQNRERQRGKGSKQIQ